MILMNPNRKGTNGGKEKIFVSLCVIFFVVFLKRFVLPFLISCLHCQKKDNCTTKRQSSKKRKEKERKRS